MIRSCNCSGGLASTLEKRRKQSAVSSCQVCGGKQLVGRSPSKKMVSTVGLELTSVMNTDFTWKTVTKGNRSATRRARKPVANKESEVHSNRDRKVEDMPVSESEELGVKVLGRRFSDKIEHVPIKKRRFLIRSPSPPPRRPQMHSLQPDQTEQLVNSQSSLFQLPNSIAKDRACENVPEGNEDFSGISILAAAACSNSIEGMGAKAEESCTAEEDSSLQLCSKVLPSTATCIKTSTSCKSTANPVQIPNNGNDSTVSTAPLEQTAVLTETTNLSQNLATHSNKLADGKNVEVPVSDISEPIKLNHAVDKDVGAGRACERFVLELDLNVPMNDDDWESFEDPDPKAQGNAVCSTDCGKEETFLSDLAHIPVGDSKNDVERTVHHITSDGAVLADVSNSADTRNLIPVTNESEGKLHNLDALTVTDSSISIHEKHAPSDFNNAPNALELKQETNFADKEKININVVVPAAVEHNMPLTMEDSSAVPNELSPTPCVSYGSGEDSEILSSHEVGKEDACSGNYCHTGSNYTAKLSSECIDEECPVDPEALIGDCSEGSDSLKSLKVEKHHVSVPDTSVAISVGASQLSPNSEEMSTKHFVVASDEKLKDSKINTLEEDNQNIADLGASVHIETKEFFHKSSWEGSDLVDNHSNSSGKFALEEGTCNGSDYRSDAYHHDHGHTLGTQMTSEIQDGYDSQYEDGELREPAVHCWDEEFGDEGDAEHVDYGSDNRDTNSYDATADFSDSMPVQVDKKIDCRKDRSAEFAYVSSEVDQVQQQGVHQGNPDDSFIRGDAGKESRQSIESRMNGGWDELPQRNRVSGENKMHPCTDGLDSKDSMVRSSRRDFQSRIDGPTSTYLLHRNGTSSLQGNRSNNFDDANCREERKFGYVKSIGRGGSPLRFQGRGRGGDRRVDPSGRNWGTNHHAPGYYSPTGFVQSGSKSAVVAAAKLESNGFVIAPDGTIVKARILGPSGRGHRRASPSDRAEAFSVHMGIGQMEARRSPDRSIRGRPVRYGPRVNGTGYRERYNGSAADGNIGSLRGPRPFDRRERSFSPNHRRGVQRQSRSHTRSRSRSRSRSPRLWSSPRGRIGGGPGFRQCSRSPPNFRYETRMNRMRSPHRRPNFGTDHIVDFSSTTRSRRSSPHSSRWINGRKDAGDHFREHGYRQRPERSSPERMFRRAQRFNLPDSPIRLRADEYYRPAHSGKFSEMVGADRGSRFDGSDDDRRIHSSKYGMSHPRRRYDADDTVKRFRYTMEDSFPVHNAGKDSSVFHGRGSPKAFVRNIDNRLGDGPRQDREENGHFRCARDVKFNVNSESTGMQDCDEEVAPATERSS